MRSERTRASEPLTDPLNEAELSSTKQAAVDRLISLSKLDAQLVSCMQLVVIMFLITISLDWSSYLISLHRLLRL